MGENRLCQCCKKNHAARTREGKKGLEFYCLECYSRLFVGEGDGKEEHAFLSCPYCGTTLAEVQKTKLVGCAHCYETMQAGLFPLVQKMQGGRAHEGKTPPLDGEYDPTDPLDLEYRARAIAKTRYQKQLRELEIIIHKLKAEGNISDAKDYEEKLVIMKNRGAIEEDFVWRTRRNLSKQS